MGPEQLGSIIDRIENNFPRIPSLFFGYFLLFLFAQIANGLFNNLGIDSSTQIVVFVIFLFVWLAVWIYFRIKLPRSKKDKIGIIFSIKTENNSQKIRYKNDLIKKVRDLAIKKGVLGSFEIITLSDFQAERVSNALNNYVAQKGAHASKDKLNKSEFAKIQKKIRGNLYIWGDIKERNDIDEKYIIEIDALVFHLSVDSSVSKALESDISSTWIKQIKFKKNNEFAGFNVSANLIFISAEYILGLAAYVSRDVNLALDLHRDCKSEINKIGHELPNLARMNNSLNTLITEETIIKSILKYTQGDKDEARDLLDNLLKDQPGSYEANVAKSVLEYNDGNIEESLKATIKAERAIGNIKSAGTHQYNKAFLLMVKGRYKEAFKIYQNISKSTYAGEKYNLMEIGVFLRNVVKSHEDLVEAYFVLGYLEYKKNNNYSSAYTNFDTFIKKTEGNEKYSYLNVRAKTYFNELKNKMGIVD